MMVYKWKGVQLPQIHDSLTSQNGCQVPHDDAFDVKYKAHLLLPGIIKTNHYHYVSESHEIGNEDSGQSNAIICA